MAKRFAQGQIRGNVLAAWSLIRASADQLNSYTTKYFYVIKIVPPNLWFLFVIIEDNSLRSCSNLLLNIECMES